MSKRYGFAGHECLIVFAVTSILAAVLVPVIERTWKISWWLSWPLAVSLVYVLYLLLMGCACVRDYADRIREARRRK